MSATVTAPIRETRINQILYAGEAGIRTLQAAVDFARNDGGKFTIVIQPGYAGSEAINSIVNGTANISIADRRDPAAPQNYEWDSEYIPTPFQQAADIMSEAALISTGNPLEAPAGSVMLMFDPSGSGGSGSANLHVTGIQDEGFPTFNLQMIEADGSNFRTFIRADHDSNSLPRITFPENTDITGDLAVSGNIGATSLSVDSIQVTDATIENSLIVNGGTELNGPLAAMGNASVNGILTLAHYPTQPLEAATKAYVDDAIAESGNFVYPAAGLAISTGTAWDETPDGRAFTNKALAAYGSASPLDVSKSAAIIGAGFQHNHPNLTLINASATANNKAWTIAVFPNAGQGDSLSFATEDDAGSANYWMAVWRNGANATKVEIKPPLTLDGNLTANGQVNVTLNTPDQLRLTNPTPNSYSVFRMQTDSRAWQIGAGGSGTGDNYANAWYLYDEKAAKGWFTIHGDTGQTELSGPVTAAVSVSTPYVGIIGNGGNNGMVDFGNNFGQTAIRLFHDTLAPSNDYGIGLNPAEMQFYIGSQQTPHFSWNTGGALQPSGTNELMRLYYGGLLNVKAGVQLGNSQLYLFGSDTPSGGTQANIRGDSNGDLVLSPGTKTPNASLFLNYDHGATGSGTIFGNGAQQEVARMDNSGNLSMNGNLAAAGNVNCTSFGATGLINNGVYNVWIPSAFGSMQYWLIAKLPIADAGAHDILCLRGIFGPVTGPPTIIDCAFKNRGQWWIWSRLGPAQANCGLLVYEQPDGSALVYIGVRPDVYNEAYYSIVLGGQPSNVTLYNPPPSTTTDPATSGTLVFWSGDEVNHPPRNWNA